MEYFKDYSGNAVIFITDDKGFKNNASVLCKEFEEYTGKAIEMQDKSF